MQRTPIEKSVSTFIETLVETVVEPMNNRHTEIENILKSVMDKVEFNTKCLAEYADKFTKFSDSLKEVSELKEEFTNYQKVSIVTNLSKQLSERENELKFLTKRLIKMENLVENQKEEMKHISENITLSVSTVSTDSSNEEIPSETEATEAVGAIGAEKLHSGNEAVEETGSVSSLPSETEGEEEAELIEIMLKPKGDKKKIKFYVTEDDDREIYTVLENGDPSDDPIGKLVGKGNRPHWYE